MSDTELREAAAGARPGVLLRPVDGPVDELVLHGGGEVLRLPRSAAAAERVLVVTRLLPRLCPLLPVPLPAPRLVGVLADGTPFSAERRLPGEPPGGRLGPIAAGQLAGLLAALHGVGAREADEWGVPGQGVLLHGALGRGQLLVDPGRGVLTGVVGWAPRRGPAGDDLRLLPPDLIDPGVMDPGLVDPGLVDPDLLPGGPAGGGRLD